MRFYLFILSAVFCCFYFTQPASGQDSILKDSCTISLLTEGPASDFYTAWGHSAIRIHDLSTQADTVYNFGGFDFNTPYFYLKFMRGTLPYTEYIYPFSIYIAEALEDPHRIIEQELRLSRQEKQRISDELHRLYEPQNRYYIYDWSRINCSTKLRDVLITALQNRISFSKKIYPQATSFRSHEEPYLESSPWLKFGTNILLGSPVDVLISPYEETFLPDGLYSQVKLVKKADGTPLVLHESVLLNGHPKMEQTALTPVLVFWLLFLLVLALSFNKTAAVIVDALLFPACGIIGLVIVFLWFGANHSETKNNWNLLWAFPVHLIYPLLRGKLRFWYSWVILGLTILLLSAWGIIPQKMEPAILAILLMQNIRALFNLGIRDVASRVLSVH